MTILIFTIDDSCLFRMKLKMALFKPNAKNAAFVTEAAWKANRFVPDLFQVDTSPVAPFLRLRHFLNGSLTFVPLILT